MFCNTFFSDIDVDTLRVMSKEELKLAGLPIGAALKMSACSGEDFNGARKGL